MKKTVTYDVELIDYILQMMDSRVIPQMTFKNTDDILIMSNMINALREQGTVDESEDTCAESDSSTNKTKAK